jgi:uncharacterized protein YkwD
MNYIDILIIIFLTGFIVIGILRGFFNELLTLIGFIFALFVSFIFYTALGKLIYNKFQIPSGFSNLISFLLIFSVFQTLWMIISPFIYKKISPRIENIKKLNKILGVIPGLVDGAIVISIILLTLLLMPFSPSLKSNLSDSRVANFFLNKFAFVDKQLSQVFAPAASEAQAKINNLGSSYLPENSSKISFPNDLILTVDAKSENRMVQLVNIERTSRGLSPLVVDSKLTEIARQHSEEMFKLSYFDHISPISGSPFDRMKADGITYISAGENIAYAPNVDVSHNGLMNSPEHKANILDSDFNKIGIGIISAGPWGEMFTQDFTN